MFVNCEGRQFTAINECPYCGHIACHWLRVPRPLKQEKMREYEAMMEAWLARHRELTPSFSQVMAHGKYMRKHPEEAMETQTIHIWGQRDPHMILGIDGTPLVGPKPAMPRNEAQWNIIRECNECQSEWGEL
jgi:hypothetical protein